MAFDMLLKFDPEEKGESKIDGHKEEIDVLSWSFGATQSGNFHMGGGGGTGKANVQDISITKYLDAASPQLFLSCATGKHYDGATLVCRKAGDKPMDYLKIKLTQVLLSSYQTGGSGGEDRLTESVSLNFSKIEMDYAPQTEKGAAAGHKTVKFDVAANKKL